MAVSSFAAVGCVPNYAEHLSTNEAETALAALDFVNEHMDLAEDVAAHADPKLLFVNNQDIISPTPADVRAQWEEENEVGYDMLENDRIYVYRGETFPDTVFHHDAGAGAYVNFDGRYAVFLEWSLADPSVQMHEFGHVVSGKGHELDKHYTVEEAVSLHDMSYRDTYIFDAVREIGRAWECLGIYDQSSYTYNDSTQSEEDNYKMFAGYYDIILRELLLIQNHLDDWAQEKAQRIYDLSAQPAQKIQLSQDAMRQMFLKPYMNDQREYAISQLQRALNDMKIQNPEFYRRYQLDKVKNSEMSPQELRRRSARSRPM